MVAELFDLHRIQTAGRGLPPQVGQELTQFGKQQITTKLGLQGTHLLQTEQGVNRRNTLEQKLQFIARHGTFSLVRRHQPTILFCNRLSQTKNPRPDH